MTENDQREQQKEVFFQAAEAKRDLNAVKMKAERVGLALLMISEGLKDNPEVLLDSDWNSKLRKSLGLNSGALVTAGEYQDTFTFDAWLKLANECREERLRLDLLNQQKEKLGLASY